MPTGIHTGVTIVEPERSLIIAALATGESTNSIAKRLNRSWETVAAVRDAEWEKVLERKPILAAQAERNALLAGEQIAQALAQGKFPVNSLPVVYGVSIDKVIALRDPMSGAQQHLHLHLQPNDVAGRFNALLASLTEKARLLPPRDVTPHHTNTSDAPTDAPTPTDSVATDVSSSQECEHLHAPAKNTNALEVSES